MTTEQLKEQETREWAAKQFGIPVESILWYHSGICYDRIGVTTKESADKVTSKVDGESVNGGMYHGMPLGGQTHYKNDATPHYDVMC